MADKTNFTVQDCLQGAFQALLRGDTHWRKLYELVGQWDVGTDVK